MGIDWMIAKEMAQAIPPAYVAMHRDCMGTADRPGELEISRGGSRVRIPPCTDTPVYAVTMADDPQAGSLTERIGAACVLILALGLLFIAVDSLTGGKLTGRGCGCDDDGSGS